MTTVLVCAVNIYALYLLTFTSLSHWLFLIWLFFCSRKSLAPIPEVESELEEDDEDITADMSEKSEEQKDLEATQEKEDTDAYTIEKPVLNVHTPDRIVNPETNGDQKSYDPHSKGWQTIPKPKGHSRLDYSRWDRVEDDSSEEDDEEDEEDDDTHPQYRFRVKNVDIRPVK